MKPGSPSASSSSALLVPFISLSPGSQWTAGKSGAAFLTNKTSLAHKRRGDVGWTSLAPLPLPQPLAETSLLLHSAGTLQFESSEGAAKPLWSARMARHPLHWGGLRNDGTAVSQVCWNGCSLLPFNWLGRQFGEEARPAGSRERHQIQREQQRKQTNRALCGCRLAARKGIQACGGEEGEGEGKGGEGREARPLLWTRDKRLEQPRLGVQLVGSATLCGQESQPESQLCHFTH